MAVFRVDINTDRDRHCVYSGEKHKTSQTSPLAPMGRMRISQVIRRIHERGMPGREIQPRTTSTLNDVCVQSIVSLQAPSDPYIVRLHIWAYTLVCFLSMVDTIQVTSECERSKRCKLAWTEVTPRIFPPVKELEIVDSGNQGSLAPKHRHRYFARKSLITPLQAEVCRKHISGSMENSAMRFYGNPDPPTHMCPCE
jgi:hypothetical protein